MMSAGTTPLANEGDRGGAFSRTLAVATPRVLYGLRMSASVSLAMWVAFWLQLENAYWAPLTAAIVCQPSIGASLRKGQFRILGTCIGAFAIVVLTAAMPQSRIGLLAALAVWGGTAGFVATLLKNNAAYAASLAGYTAVIVFSDAISATPGDVFILAVTRATEISIGVLAAGLVLAATDLGDARRRLGETVAAILAEVTAGLMDTLSLRLDHAQSRTGRRALLGRVIALDALTDDVIGESSEVRARSRTLQSGVEGLLAALAAWGGISAHLDALPDEQARRGAATVMPEFAALEGLDWRDDPATARRKCLEEAKRVLATPVRTPSARLLADRAAKALLGLRDAANGLVLIAAEPREAVASRAASSLTVPDLLPAFVNGLRVLGTMVIASIIWIETAWPGGEQLLVFSSVVTILFAPQAERAYAIVRQFAFGVFTASVLAAVVKFAVLPQQQTFLALSLVIGAVLVPAAAFAAGTWKKFYFTGITFIFVALLAPANSASFDVSGFFNSSLGIVGGVVLAACAFRLIPPLVGERRTQRLLRLTLFDLRRLAAGRRLRTRAGWLGLVSARLGTMTDAAPLDQARLLAGFTAGYTVIWLRHQARHLAAPSRLEEAMSDLAGGRIAQARAALARFAASQPDGAKALRARAEAELLCDILRQYPAFFADAGEQSVS